MPTTAPTTLALSSDLATYAARLVRALRRNNDLPAGARIVSLLDEHGPLGVSALAAADRCSQPTMSAAVAGLVEKGWVDKLPHPDDARSSVITLTDAGRSALAHFRRANGTTVAARFEAHPTHTPEDLATAVAVLRDLLDPTYDPERGTL